jgi:hypothetical protein
MTVTDLVFCFSQPLLQGQSLLLQGVVLLGQLNDLQGNISIM